MNTPPDDKSSASITQEDLEEFAALRNQFSPLKRRYEEMRDRLIQLAESRASVEPGRLDIAVNASERRNINKAYLIQVLGAEDYENLRAGAPPTILRRLVVAERTRK